MRERTPASRWTAERGSVAIELSQAQVDRVVRDACDAGSVSLLMQSGLFGLRDVLARADQLDDARMSRSLLLGLLLLSTLPADGSYVSLTEVARTVGMTMSTAHRYVHTLVTVGLLERKSSTRKYRLAYGG